MCVFNICSFFVFLVCFILFSYFSYLKYIYIIFKLINLCEFNFFRLKKILHLFSMLFIFSFHRFVYGFSIKDASSHNGCIFSAIRLNIFCLSTKTFVGFSNKGPVGHICRCMYVYVVYIFLVICCIK